MGNVFSSISQQSSLNNKPRRAKSLKDPSYKDHLPSFTSHIQDDSPSHGRDISFYTYIAPDPNHARGLFFEETLILPLN